MAKSLRRASAIGVIISAVALVVSGCAAGNSGPGSSSAAAVELPNVAWDSATADQIQDGGTLTLAVGNLPVNWNPSEIDGNESEGILVASPTAGGVFVIGADGTPTVDPDYAVSAELTSSDPQVVEVKLNPKAVWQDGTPITVKDWIGTWKASNGSNDKYQVVSTTGWDQIKSIEQGTDQFDMKITFSQKYADWQALFTQVLPTSVTDTPEHFNTGFVSKAMPSAGPYIVSSIDTSGGVATLTRNPKWWGATPKLDTITFKVISQESQGASFANSEIDAVDIGASADTYATAEARSDASIQRTSGLTWTHVTLNAGSGPLADVNVRKAIASAINREVLAASAANPVGATPVTQDNYIFMPGQKGYSSSAALPYDVSAAAAYLEKAGYTQAADKTWSKDGKTLTLSMIVPAGTPTNKQRAVQVQSDLAAIGITVKLDEVPAAKFFSDYVIPKSYELVTFSWVGTPFPISSAESVFYPVDSGQNFTNITDDTLGDLWKKANSELDPTARLAIADQINTVIWNYVPVIPLAPLPNVYAVKNGLVNYGAAEFKSVDWTLVGWKK